MSFLRQHRLKLVLLAIYAAALIPSNMVTTKPRLDPRKDRVELPVMDDNGPTGRVTDLPYLAWQAGPDLQRAATNPQRAATVRERSAGGHASEPDRSLTVAARGVPVILQQGTPGDANNFAPGPGFGSRSEGLGPVLAEERDTYALDLPGMGDHFDDVPTRSAWAHARTVLAFMDAKGIERAHVVGWSQGGAVALFMSDLDASRLESITLLASVGAQETEGSGDFYFEHAKYALGIAASHGAEWLVPHFGTLDPMLRLLQSSMHNFWDTDQRPLRELMESLEVPTFILHGEYDFLVAASAARRHHAMIPGSRIRVVRSTWGDHFMPFTRPREVGRLLGAFFDHAERGEELAQDVLDGAPPVSTPAILHDLDAAIGELIYRLPWAVTAALIACSAFGLPVLTASFMAMLVATSRADLGVVLVGLVAGHAARRVDRGRSIGPAFGVPLLALLLAPMVAGVIHSIAGTMVCPPFGEVPRLATHGPIWIGTVPLAVVVGVAPGLLSRAGRRRLRMGLSRAVRHEFWPASVFYLPLVPYVMWLSIRHGGVRAFTRCNPGITGLGGVGGGIVGESKSKIQAALGEHPAVLGTTLIEEGPTDERIGATLRAIETYPVILKPDAGQRGFAVRLARRDDDVRAYVESFPRAFVVQAYHPGPCECGIMTVRRPGSDRHEIFSITRKTFPVVTGDGKTTLGDLVWRHPRYRLQALVFEERWKHRWDDVLGDGEMLRLAESGNHAQGTMFTDGSELVTPELEAVIADIAASFDGYDFGRFDVRYESDELLRRGEGFGIVELNGITAESTNLYDPSWSVLRAYRVLFGQWKVAYEIGGSNKARGVRAVGVLELAAAMRAFYLGRPEAVSS